MASKLFLEYSIDFLYCDKAKFALFVKNKNLKIVLFNYSLILSISIFSLDYSFLLRNNEKLSKSLFIFCSKTMNLFLFELVYQERFPRRFKSVCLT